MKLTHPYLVLLLLAASCTKTNQQAALIAEDIPVKRVTISDAISQTGEVRPIVKVEVKSEASGRIEKISVKAGQQVKRNDTILRIDPSRLLFKKQQLDLSVKRSLIQRDLVHRDLQNAVELQQTGTIAENKVQDLRSQYDLAAISYEQQMLELKDITDQLGKTVVLAPMNGVITNLYVEEGEIAVSAVSGFQNGTAIATIADISSLEVVSQIGEVDYVHLKLGQRVIIRPEAIENARTSGKITFIALNAKKESNQELGSFEVRISVDEVIPGIAPGINVNVEFILKEKKDVLAVPFRCVQREGRKHYVMMRGPGGKDDIVRREVEVGSTDYRNYEILSGLKEGDTVVYKRESSESRRGGQQGGAGGGRGQGGGAAGRAPRR